MVDRVVSKDGRLEELGVRRGGSRGEAMVDIFGARRDGDKFKVLKVGDRQG